MIQDIDSEFLFKERTYQVVGNIQWCKDNDYGADADGNRGMSLTFVDHYELNAYFIDAEGDAVLLNEADAEPIIQEYIDKHAIFNV